MAKSPIPVAKTATELSALLTQETQAYETAQAEHVQLAAQDTQIARQGIDPLRRHREFMQNAELRRDVAKANADGFREQLAEAQQREAAHARQVRYDSHAKGRDARQDRYRKDLSAAYDALFAALEAGKLDQDETTAINKDLPVGAQPIEHFEAPMRHTAETPDRREMVEVQRRKETSGIVFARAGQDFPMETVREERVIRGSRAIRPPALWDLIELPALDRSNGLRRVGGTQPVPEFLKIA